MERQIPLLVICGPTACGKTGLSIELAKRFGGEVISADSMQIYRHMNIGTAKPTQKEKRGVPHHLLDILEPGESFSVARYVELAKAVIREIADREKLPVVAGGTGLYIDSLTRNIQFAEMREDPELRRRLNGLAGERGNEAVWELLRQCDPALADKLHPNNLGRVIRGVEVFRATGVPQSEWQRRSRLSPPEYRLCMLGLAWERETLYRRIDERVGRMLESGLLEEAKSLLDAGLSPTAAQAIGYKELAGYFSGEKSQQQAAEDIKRETRRYAKRQMTWLRRDERIHWLRMETFDTPASLIAAAAEIVAGTLGGE